VTPETAGYPLHWEADVVLADGGTAHLRPITADDADRLVAFFSRLSAETIRYRFFAAHPRLTPREVEHFTRVDYDERVALVAVLGQDLIGVGRYDRVPDSDVAEVAFVIDDAQQGRGLGSILLEHLATAAAERGIRRFEADVLAENRRMVRIFLDAGYSATSSYEQDDVHLVFPIEPTAASRAVVESREHRSEARSIGRVLAPRSVAVVGASCDPDSVGHVVLLNLLRSGFTGPVYPVNPNAGSVASVRAYSSVADVPDDIDLAVLTVPPSAVAEVIPQCAAKRVRALVVITDGYRETGPAGAAAEAELVAAARANGMRVIGPNCLGVMSTAPEVQLNATLAPTLPRRGRAGFFCQSGALGVAVLESVRQRGLGLSTVVSAGNRADVSGNDLLQFWEDDPATDVILLYLESFGNPRKFARLARRIGRRKPIVAVRSGRSGAIRLAATDVREGVVDALFRQAGVIRVDSMSHLLDVATLLTAAPLPGGRRVAIVGSAALGPLAAEVCAGSGLVVEPFSPPTREALRGALGPTAEPANPLVLPPGCGAAELGRALDAVLADPAIDAVITAYVPPLRTLAAAEVARVVAAASADAVKPVVSVLPLDDAPPGSVPGYRSPEEAVSALASTVEYAAWRRTPEGELPHIADVDPTAARAVIDAALRDFPAGAALPPPEARRLLAAYGVPVWRSVAVASAEEAVARAAELGYPVAIKATAESLRHRPELGTVRLDIASAEELRAAYRTMTARLGEGAELAVQAMAPTGVATEIRATEDPSFGALLSFGVASVATDLLGDRAHRIVPLTTADAAELVRSVRAAPLLFGYRGAAPVDVAALERLLVRVAKMVDDLPEIAELVLNPVMVSAQGVEILASDVRVAPPASRPDAGPRRLR